MGPTHITTTVRNLTGRGKSFTAEFFVDTTLLDCLAPAEALRNAGIKPEGKAFYQLADEQPAEREYGFARIKFLGMETVVQIIFGPEGCEPVLGVVALINTGLMIDRKTMTLHRVHGRTMK